MAAVFSPTERSRPSALSHRVGMPIFLQAFIRSVQGIRTGLRPTQRLNLSINIIARDGAGFWRVPRVAARLAAFLAAALGSIGGPPLQPISVSPVATSTMNLSNWAGAHAAGVSHRRLCRATCPAAAASSAVAKVIFQDDIDHCGLLESMMI